MKSFDLSNLPRVSHLALRSRMMRRVAGGLLVVLMAVQFLAMWPAYVHKKASLEQDLQHEITAAVLASVQRRRMDLRTGSYEGAVMEFTETMQWSHLVGGTLFDSEGRSLAQFGEPLYFTPEELSAAREVAAGNRLEFVVSTERLEVPVQFAVRADTTWIPGRMAGFLWVGFGVMIVISLLGFIGVAFVIAHTILDPLNGIRSRLVAASQDPVHADQFASLGRAHGVLNDIAKLIQQLLQRVSTSFREQLASLAAMIEHTGDIIFAYDADGFLVYANKACLRCCGVSNLQELKSLGGPLLRADGGAHDQSLTTLLDGDTLTGQIELVGPGPKPVRCMISAARLRTDEGRVTRTFATMTDITAMHDAYVAREEQNKELEEANRIKSDFLAQVSHELRTPLNAIIGFSEILSSRFTDAADDDIHVFVEDINNSGHHLLGLINNILDLSKLEAGKTELRESNADIIDIAKSAMAMLRETARKQNITLECDYSSNSIEVRCDAMRIKQVILNLLSNAIKFSAQGGSVTLSIQQTNEGLKVCVTDTGIGMKPEDIPRALQPFAQIDSGFSRKYEGTGLGLPICAGLIEAHGGKIYIDSTPGKGTAVRFTLPLNRVASRAA